jgi:hypothetical protein
MVYAPVVLFVYNRTEHLRFAISALSKNEGASQTDLIVYSDGSKSDNDLGVIEVRKYIKTILGFKSLIIHEASQNKGLAQSIIDGVSEVISQYGRVIVLEDDIITSPLFLNYMNSSLELYKDENKVMHVSGYMFPIDDRELPNAFFLKPATCWGWATWDRAWKYFSNDIQQIEKSMNKEMIKDFNLNNNYDYYSQVILNKKNKIKTWAVFWYASCFLNNGLSLHPKKSYCLNIGHDGSGTHCDTNDSFNVILEGADPSSFEKIEIVENLVARKRVETFFGKNKKSFAAKLVSKFKNIYHGITQTLKGIF